MTAYKYIVGKDFAGVEIVENSGGKIIVRCLTCNDVFQIHITALRRKERGGKRGCVKCITRRTDDDFIYEQAFLDYKKKAEERSLSFNLTFDEFKEYVTKNCHYCSQPPFSSRFSKESWHSKVKVNGVDRKNNAVGYEVYNCVTCCGICNRAKSSMSYKDFMIYINRIRNFNG